MEVEHSADESTDGTYFAELTTLRNQLDVEWRHREPAPPDVLYHYTSPAGAVGIVKSGKLWATEALHLNDESELTHASSILRSILEKRQRAACSAEERLLFSRELHSVDITQANVLRFFVASLTEANDSLSQWQAYAAGGCGIALGFDASTLLKMSLMEDLAPNFSLARVIYEYDQQREWLEWVVQHWFEYASKAVKATRGKLVEPAWFLSGLYSFLAVCSCEYLPNLKIHHFASEKEWRLGNGQAAESSLTPVLTRSPQNTPYIELDLRRQGRIPLVQLVLGPGYRDPRSQAVARVWLDSAGYEDVGVVSSEVPLRTTCGVLSLNTA